MTQEITTQPESKHRQHQYVDVVDRTTADAWWASSTDAQRTAHHERLQSTRQDIRDQCKRISEAWKMFRDVQRNKVSASDVPADLQSPHILSRNYRHWHIAYSLLRGRTMDQIEKPGEFNGPDMALVNRFKSQIAGKLFPPAD